MRIGILGSGSMGGTLGTLFARAGHDVVFSYARGEQKLKRLARDAGANAVAAEPIRDVGFDPVSAGPLRIARYLEPFALLMGQLAYETDDGSEVTYRFERFGE